MPLTRHYSLTFFFSNICILPSPHQNKYLLSPSRSQQDAFEPSKFRSRIEVDAPTTKIYRFHGSIIHPSGAKVPVGTENLLLRECLLKNTDFVEGIVVYAGHETKAMLNNGGPRYKRSSLERQMNQDVIWCVLILIVLCLIGAIGCKLWLGVNEYLREPFRPEGQNDTMEAFLSFWIFVIILQVSVGFVLSHCVMVIKHLFTCETMYFVKLYYLFVYIGDCCNVHVYGEFCLCSVKKFTFKYKLSLNVLSVRNIYSLEYCILVALYVTKLQESTHISFLFQIMIPLSLYVTLEMCKIIQVYHIHNNVDLYDPVMDRRTECRALNITEELGQIQYIFSDKTGTLTENRMIFR